MTKHFVFIVSLAMLAAVTGIMFAPARSGEQTVFQLPEPQTDGGRPLMQVLRDRQSQRSFSAKKLPPQILSNLLWAAFGVNRPESGLRTAPSALNVQEIDIYLAMEEGLYRYDAAGHQIHRVLADDIRKETAISLMWDAYASPAPLNLIYVADLNKMSRNLCYADTGFITQNVYLYCASEGLCTVVRGTLPQTLSTTMGLTENQIITVVQTVGFNAYEQVLYFPYVNTRGDWETEIALVNTSRVHSLRGVLKAYDSKGMELSSIDLAGTGFSIDLGPRDRKKISIDKAFPRPDDICYLIFSADSEQCIGFARLSVAGRYRAALPATRKVSTEEITFFPIAFDQEWWTRLCLLNTTYRPQELTMAWNNGATRILSLRANGQTSFNLSDLFSEPPQEAVASAVIHGGEGLVGVSLVGSENQVCGLLSETSPASRLYFPHVAVNDTWQTEIAVYNPAGQACSAVVTACNDSGEVVGTGMLHIDGHSLQQAAVGEHDALPLNTAWITIETTGGIFGAATIHGSDNERMARYNALSLRGKAGILPNHETDGWTAIALVNVEEAEASVTLSAYKDNGKRIATGTTTIGGYAKKLENAFTFFSDDISEAAYFAYTADRELVGIQMNGSADNTMLDALPAEVVAVEVNDSSGGVDDTVNDACLVCHEPHTEGGPDCLSCHELDGSDDDNGDDGSAPLCLLCHESHNGSERDCFFCHAQAHSRVGDSKEGSCATVVENGCLVCHEGHGAERNCLFCHQPHWPNSR